MNAARQLRYSYEDYLRALERGEFKFEYSAGLIYALAAGRRRTPSCRPPPLPPSGWRSAGGAR